MTKANNTSKEQESDLPTSEEKLRDLIKEMINKGHLDRELSTNFGVKRRGH